MKNSVCLSFSVLAAALAPTIAHAGLFGNTGDEQDCPKYRSRGWCILDSADLSKDVSDVRLEEFKRALAKNGIDYQKSDIPTLLMMAGTSSGVFTPLGGVSKGFDLTMLALNLILNVRPPASTDSFVLAWMPAELAESPEEAKEIYWGELHSATLKAFNDHELQEISLPAEYYKSPYRIRTPLLFGYQVLGGDCNTKKCLLYSPYEWYTEYPTPKRGKAPKWLGGYDAWIFQRWSAGHPMNLKVDEESFTANYTQKLSANLPAWAFVSTGTEYKSGKMTINKGRSVIIVFNKGEPWPLIFPEPASTGTKVDAASPQQQSSP